MVYDREIVTNCRGRKQILSRDYPGMEALEKGEELGRFEFGSTVILLLKRIASIGSAVSLREP